MKEITMNEFVAQGTKLFGKNKKDWKFRCISCGESQTFNDFKDAGVEDPSGFVHFSCVGRFNSNRGCNWTLGGLFTIHQKEVEGHAVFNFEGELYDEEREKALLEKKTMAFDKQK